MTTWTLWIGAVLVVGGSAAQLARHAVAAGALWVLAVLVFVAAAASAVFASEFSLPLLLILVVAIAATVALVSLTRVQPARSVTRESAQSVTRERVGVVRGLVRRDRPATATGDPASAGPNGGTGCLVGDRRTAVTRLRV